jgi:hypothetical protein
VTGFERLEMARAIRLMLRGRFGDEANDLAKAVGDLYDAEKYDIFIEKCGRAKTLEEAKQVYAEVAALPTIADDDDFVDEE